MRFALALVVVPLAACGGEKTESKEKRNTSGDDIVTVGVYPEQFTCESLAPLAELAVLGDGLAAAEPPETNPPRGVARPCNYVTAVPASQFDGDAGPEQVVEVSWSFDLDCRAGAVKEAEELRAEYSKMEGDPDAGVPATVEVDVGRWGTDHLRSQLLFVDRDVDCYVRVRGPSAEGRLALARVIEQHLTETTAVREPPEYRRKTAK
jgi:hypothetical protein